MRMYAGTFCSVESAMLTAGYKEFKRSQLIFAVEEGRSVSTIGLLSGVS